MNDFLKNSKFSSFIHVYLHETHVFFIRNRFIRTLKLAILRKLLKQSIQGPSWILKQHILSLQKYLPNQELFLTHPFNSKHFIISILVARCIIIQFLEMKIN